MKSLLDMQNEIVRDYAHKVAEYESSALYAYLIGMIQALEARGEDPANWEIVFVESEYPEETDSGFKITRRVRVRKFRND